MLTNNNIYIKKIRVCQEISLVYGDSRTPEQRDRNRQKYIFKFNAVWSIVTL